MTVISPDEGRINFKTHAAAQATAADLLFHDRSSRRFFPARFSSWRDADKEIKPSRKRVVDLSSIAGGEDREASVFLDSLEEIIDLNVGVTIVAIMHLGAFAKEGISFVEKEDCTTSFRRIEDASQILLRLANIYRDDGAQIDALEIFSQIAGHSLRGDELTDPVFAGE
jgi:hypothetical protein